MLTWHRIHGKAFLYLVWSMTLILFCLNIKQHTYACAHTLKHTHGFSDEQKYVKIKQKLETLQPLLSLYISEKNAKYTSTMAGFSWSLHLILHNIKIFNFEIRHHTMETAKTGKKNYFIFFLLQ